MKSGVLLTHGACVLSVVGSSHSRDKGRTENIGEEEKPREKGLGTMRIGVWGGNKHYFLI